MQLTMKQFSIMAVIIKGDGKDAAGNLIPVDMDQLLERLSYKTSKDSMQFSIRALIAAKLIYKGPRETRRGRGRVVYFPTELGRRYTMLGASPSFIEPNPSDPILATLHGKKPAAEDLSNPADFLEPNSSI